MYYLTVVTPTYNRAHTIARVYKSLKEQNFPDFEWLIIDDGSTDNTKEVVEEFIKDADFPIRYFYKKNGGRHTALNLSYKYLNSKYVINKDSDDEFAPNTFWRIKEIWDTVPKEDYDRFWCISGRCLDSTTNNMIGELYPTNINELRGKAQHKAITKITGEKSCCRKVEIVKQFPFPVYKDTKFVTENVIWEKINQKYDQYCVNDIFRVYYPNSEDSLTSGNMHSSQRRSTYYYASLFYINECFSQVFYNKNIILGVVNLSRCALLSKRTFKKTLSDVEGWHKKSLVILGYPISMTWILIKQRNEFKKQF